MRPPPAISHNARPILRDSPPDDSKNRGLHKATALALPFPESFQREQTADICHPYSAKVLEAFRYGHTPPTKNCISDKGPASALSQKPGHRVQLSPQHTQSTAAAAKTSLCNPGYSLTFIIPEAEFARTRGKYSAEP